MCSIEHFKNGVLPILDVMIYAYDLIEETSKTGNFLRELNTINDEINEFWKSKGLGDAFPFNYRDTQYAIKAMLTQRATSTEQKTDDADANDSWGDFFKKKATKAAQHVKEGVTKGKDWAEVNFAYGHEFVEILGKDGCFYTMGLYTEGDGMSYILINDFGFTNCRTKNKECYERIHGLDGQPPGPYTVPSGNFTVYTDDNCNILCRNMTGMRMDDKNKYVPIITSKINSLGRRMESELNINHLKLLRNIIANAEFKPLKNKIDPVALRLPLKVAYDKMSAVKFRDPTAKKVLGYLGAFGQQMCTAKDDSENCRTFADNFYYSIAKYNTDFNKYINHVPSIFEESTPENAALIAKLKSHLPKTFEIIDNKLKELP